eukprot:351850-Chlamydomonas_euryale.AAC.1
MHGHSGQVWSVPNTPTRAQRQGVERAEHPHTGTAARCGACRTPTHGEWNEGSDGPSCVRTLSGFDPDPEP